MTTEPTGVTIVKPKRTMREAVVYMVANGIEYALSALTIMLLLPYVTGDRLTPGYWQVFAGIIVLRCAWPSSSYQFWTRDYAAWKREASR